MQCYIAVDGGTTNTRAALVEDMRVVSTSRRPVGARDQARQDGASPLPAAVAECIADVLKAANRPIDSIQFIVASGMLTSNVGLLELPHVESPVGLEELAAAVEVRQLTDISPIPIHFIRGVKTSSDHGSGIPGDMMRGEEAEVFGLLTILERKGPLQFVLPGSHTKLIAVDECGRITDIRTSLTGEMIAALARHTVLAASVPDPLPTSFDPQAIQEGASWTESTGLLHAAFAVRLTHVLQKTPPDRLAALLVGAVVGSDVADMVRTGVPKKVPLLIGGADPLKSVYAQLLQTALADRSIAVQPIDGNACQNAAAIGAGTIVQRFLNR